MPDLDQLLETLVADVAARTRAAGAPTAIKQAQRRPAKVAAAAAGAVAIIAVGGALATGTLAGSDQPSPIEEPTTPSSAPPTVQESAEPSSASIGTLSRELNAVFDQVPGWAISDTFPDDYDYAFNGPCSGGLDDWGRGATSGGDGGVARAGVGGLGFPSEAKASHAAARFVGNLESCTATAWRTQPIARTRAVLASSATGVAWIQRMGDTVVVLQVPTTDGPPPLGVQVEVAEWMVAYHTWQEQD
jgi:hypothetical protein